MTERHTTRAQQLQRLAEEIDAINLDIAQIGPAPLADYRQILAEHETECAKLEVIERRRTPV